ncbi:MAG: hypothetical protein NVS4B6_13490 [Mycobacterium sp.]
MNRNTIAFAAAVMALGLLISACNSSSPSGQATSSTTAGSATKTAASVTTTSGGAPTTSANGAQLPSLIPTPANSTRTKGPDNIADNGIHLHYQVNGAPTDVMNAFKSALEGKGWALSTIVTSSGGGGGGATYTGTHGGAFDGGGFNTSTYIDVCAWPSKPANPKCARGDR